MKKKIILLSTFLLLSLYYSTYSTDKNPNSGHNWVIKLKDGWKTYGGFIKDKDNKSIMVDFKDGKLFNTKTKEVVGEIAPIDQTLNEACCRLPLPIIDNDNSTKNDLIWTEDGMNQQHVLDEAQDADELIHDENTGIMDPSF